MDSVKQVQYNIDPIKKVRYDIDSVKPVRYNITLTHCDSKKYDYFDLSLSFQDFYCKG